MAKLLLHQENGLHLLQGRRPAGSSSGYTNVCRCSFSSHRLLTGFCPLTAVEEGFCSDPWIPYNGHCFHLHRTPLAWTDAQRECRKEGGDLSSMYNVEDQSFVISQLGYGLFQSTFYVYMSGKPTDAVLSHKRSCTAPLTPPGRNTRSVVNGILLFLTVNHF